MVYWKPRTKVDLEFVSPYTYPLDGGATRKYATFEPDYGGFNNIRMTIETLLVFAKATGRTVVLPPRAPIYLLKETPITNGTSTLSEPEQQRPQQNGRKVKKLLSATDFFSEGVAKLKADGVLDVITFKEFVERESEDPNGLVSAAAARLHGKGLAEQVEREASDRGLLKGGGGNGGGSRGGNAASGSEEGGAQRKKLELVKGVRDTLLSWNKAAEAGDDASRKKIRAWIRAATCEVRDEEEAAVAAEAASGGGSGGIGTDEEAALAAQARCPKWEPLKEAVVFGRPLEGNGDDGNGGGHGGSGEGGKASAGATATRRRLPPLPTVTDHWAPNPGVPPSHAFALTDFLTNRRRARFIDGPAAMEPWVHFRTDIKDPARPLFTHWYTLFLFQEQATDLFMKRMIRDYVHYDEDVFCAAGKIVARLDAEARALSPLPAPPPPPPLELHSGNKGAKHQGSRRLRGWSSIHVRHGELQYTNVQISPEGLLNETAPWLNVPGELLYVATDESQLSWFAPMEKRHRLRFLHDFEEEVRGLDPNSLGLVEQVVLSMGRTFTGTWFSTFSAYACRLRGYYAEFPDDTCFVYAPRHKRFDFKAWKMPTHAFYPREWALAWEGIDFQPPPPPPHSAGEEAALLPPLSRRRLRVTPLAAEKPPVYPDAAVKKKKEKQKAEAGKMVQ